MFNRSTILAKRAAGRDTLFQIPPVRTPKG